MIFSEHDKPGHHYIKRLLDPMLYSVTGVRWPPIVWSIKHSDVTFRSGI